MILAEHLGVRVCAPRDIPGLSRRSLTQLTITDASSWSALTIRAGGKSLIIVNSGHSVTRQTNSVTHELAHEILGHRSSHAKVSAEGYLFTDRFDKDQEDEADWLAGCLLIPREGLSKVFRRGEATDALASHFGVSIELVEWRVRMTGVRVQANRALRRKDGNQTGKKRLA